MTPSLTPALSGRGQHGVAVGQVRGQRLLDQDVNARLRRLDGRLGVQRVRRADDHRLGAGVLQQIADVGEGPDAVLLGEGRRPARRRCRRRRRTPPPGDLAGRRRGSAPPCRSRSAPCAPRRIYASGKYFLLIRRRNASDSAISSMPFMPSSMLTQPCSRARPGCGRWRRSR